MSPSPLRKTCTLALLGVAASALAQRHTVGAAPPTAPPPHVQPAAIEPISSGLGPLQFTAVNYAVPAPQSILRQLESDDDRTRAASLAALGAPAQYLTHGHIPYPHSMHLDFMPLGSSDELDAIITVELEQHIVSAILVPDEGNWKRVGTMLLATPFDDPTTTPSTFLRTDRALLERNRYRAIFRGSVSSKNGDFTENEAHLQVVNNRAIVNISFVDASRTCGSTGTAKHPHTTGCDIVRRWLQVDNTDPQHHFLLVTGSGHIGPHEELEAIESTRQVEVSRLRFFSCQPFAFSPTTSRFEPTAAPVPCSAYQAEPQPPAEP
jgi:hypothetical protein